MCSRCNPDPHHMARVMGMFEIQGFEEDEAVADQSASVTEESPKPKE